ncbi:amidohydrolase family protein [Pseudoduganella sp. UC29_106]|uniref:amidohydrolase family protein n=1 Tax=Pseudoduganella sp. UC29_106 TaxID=3374553 RepID=UPI0037578BE9
MKKLLLGLLMLCGLAQAQPAGDYHQHLFSPAVAETIKVPPISAADLVALLDDAGIKRATLLSVAYTFGSPKRSFPDELERVRAENDWTAAQAAKYPGRLIAFCSFNPLKDYALDELARCAAHPGLKHGIKLHFGNSDVQLELPAHVERLKQVFQAANEHHMAIVVHMRASISQKRPYGAQQARIFLEQLLPQAPDVTVQVAHFAGAGPGYDDPAGEEVMGVLAEAVQQGDPRTRHLMFDIASIPDGKLTKEQEQRLVARIRQVGVSRVLYGSDAATGGNLRPREGWAAFLSLPLTKEEVATVSANVPPYWR